MNLRVFVAPMPSVSGNAENTRWKRPQEVLGRKNENNTRTMHLRECTLSEFWEIFVDDRPFGAETLFRRRECPIQNRVFLRNDGDGQDPKKGG